MRMVIGLTGPNASGKGEAARYIESKGFLYHSLSDILRDESKKLGIDTLRENLIKLGNDLRLKHGPSFLALRAIERLKKREFHIVDSIRNPAEAEALRAHGGDDFILMGIDAPMEMRFKRGLIRRRLGDAKTLEDFIKKEGEENKNNPENQQLKKCLKMADVIIINDSTIEDLHRKIDGTIKKHKKA